MLSKGINVRLILDAFYLITFKNSVVECCIFLYLTIYKLISVIYVYVFRS